MQPLVPNYVTLASRWIPLNQRLEVYLHTPLPSPSWDEYRSLWYCLKHVPVVPADLQSQVPDLWAFD